VTRCWQFRVSGRVQGVFFRASTRTQALELGVTGWVRNAADGSVEVLACGTPAAIDALDGWLRRGPPAARVTDVSRVPGPDSAPPDFDIQP